MLNNKIQYKEAYIQNQKGDIVKTEGGVILNLLISKGPNGSGKLKFIKNIKEYLLAPKPNEFKDTVVFCDSIESSYYSMLSALSASAIVVNAINYKSFSETVILGAGIGLFAGFSDDLGFDKNIVDFLIENESKEVYLDTIYNRIIIPDIKRPQFMENYEFDLDKLLRYK